MSIDAVLRNEKPWHVTFADALAGATLLPDGCLSCIVTSPPYFALRSYLKKGDPNKSLEIGWEQSIDEYVSSLVELFRELRRALHPSGVLWLNLGDTYANDAKGPNGLPGPSLDGAPNLPGVRKAWRGSGLKKKDLIGVPWVVAFALRADGWYLRQWMPWPKRNCLSGGTVVYARTQKGDMPMMVKDMVRLKPSTVKLWDGEKWNQVAHFTPAESRSGSIEIEFRNGQRIGCTPEHRWPTQRGNVEAKNLQIGDVVPVVKIPEPDEPLAPPGLPTQDVGWFVGFFLAEGCITDDRQLVFAIHQDETEYYERLKTFAAHFGATCRWHSKGNDDRGVIVAMSGPVPVGIIRAYVSGLDCYTKHLTTAAWQRSDIFLRAVLDGYLAGDGHYDEQNSRWRLGFCLNDALATDLRGIGGRLGIRVRLRRTVHYSQVAAHKGWKGEIRFASRQNVPGGFGQTQEGEIVAVRNSRARQFWDIGVESEPHLFSLASGLLTHNSMPESASDRPSTSCETIFLLTKSPDTFFDMEAVKRRSRDPGATITLGDKSMNKRSGGTSGNAAPDVTEFENPEFRNLRSADFWFDAMGMILAGHIDDTDDPTILGFDVPLTSYKGAHFATWPQKLVRDMILAGSSERGVCPQCYAPWERIVAKSRVATRPGDGSKVTGDSLTDGNRDPERHVTRTETVGWHPTCGCGTDLFPNDFDVIFTPTGGRVADDPSLTTGRAGMNRPRSPDEGTTPTTRYQQRKYAEQLRASPHRAAMTDEAGGKSTFAHYLRTDGSGAWPIPPDLLAAWIERGWLQPVGLPSYDGAPEAVPAIVFDPFTGSGTTGKVALDLNRRFLGTELNGSYRALIERRMRCARPSLF